MTHEMYYDDDLPLLEYDVKGETALWNCPYCRYLMIKSWFYVDGVWACDECGKEVEVCGPED